MEERERGRGSKRKRRKRERRIKGVDIHMEKVGMNLDVRRAQANQEAKSWEH